MSLRFTNQFFDFFNAGHSFPSTPFIPTPLLLGPQEYWDTCNNLNTVIFVITAKIVNNLLRKCCKINKIMINSSKKPVFLNSKQN